MGDATSLIPKRLHCRNLDGDQTGILILSDGRVELYFIGYDEFIHVRDDGPFYVVTEEGTVASLHANVSGRHGERAVTTRLRGKGSGREGDEHRVIYQSGLISNLAVIGTDAWQPDDLVRRLTFDVAHSKYILRHREKLRALGSAPRPSDDDLTLYRAEAGNVTLAAGYAATYGSDTQSLTSYRPTLSIEFAVGCPLNEIRPHLVHYLSFLSFVLGGRMTPAAVRVDRLSFEEMVRAVGEGTYLSDHEVRWNWPADEHEVDDLAFHGAPFLAEDDGELAALEAGLALWVSRSDRWERAYIRMTESLRLRRTISGERLLAAWRWFEELPNAGAERVFDSAALEPMIRAAAEAARAQELDIDEGRIRGRLKPLGEETWRARFTRLVGSVRTLIDECNPIDEVVSHLMSVPSFRGRIAHGHFAAQDEAELHRFHKATLAMEALCFLLTARDLPMTDAGRRRIGSHPVLEEYHLAYP